VNRRKQGKNVPSGGRTGEDGKKEEEGDALV